MVSILVLLGGPVFLYSVVDAQRLRNLLHGREADSFVVVIVRFRFNVAELTKETSLVHHCSGVAGRLRVRYDCIVLCRASKIGASDLGEHGPS